MQTLKPLDFDTLAMAYHFITDCEDESPKQYGVDLFPAFPVRRDGVFRMREPQDAALSPWHATDVEDWLIDRVTAPDEDGEDELDVYVTVTPDAMEFDPWFDREPANDVSLARNDDEPLFAPEAAEVVSRYVRGRNGVVKVVRG